MGPCSSRGPVALALFIFFFNYVVMNSIAACPFPMELLKTYIAIEKRIMETPKLKRFLMLSRGGFSDASIKK